MKIDSLDIIFHGVHYTIDDYKNFCHHYNNDLDLRKVAILMQRSPNLLFAILMLLERKCTYIPIDCSYPHERIQYIMEDSAPDYVLTDKGLERGSHPDLGGSACPDSAYILYTSGSAGQPKGVELPREALLNFIDGISDVIDFSPGKRIPCLTPVSFDVFLIESIVALYKGLTVVLADTDEQYNPKLMAKLLQENVVDMILMTPSRMQLLLNHDKELSCLANIKEIMIGGEPLSLNLLRTMQQKTTAKIYNLYGPTETTLTSTVSDLTSKDRIDIGRPIKNTDVYIVNENLFLLPTGQAGEICIAGKGLAKGYAGKADLTAEKFVFLSQNPGIRVYRTGDLGRYLPDGNLEYLGRTDNQVKIRGHRIELEEIEAHLNQIAGINQSIVTAIEASESNKVLKVFYTSDVALDHKDITEYLSSKLPEYMVPALFKRIESFIQTANGKIDRNRVLECVEIKSERSSTGHFHAARLNTIQKKALDIVVANLDLKIEDVTLEAGFADVGIDSISFIKIVVDLETEFDFEFEDEMMRLTAFPTIQSIIDYVNQKFSD